MIKAGIVADSKNEFGNRLTTWVLTFPRIVLAEFNTHRMLSRNSASSRAIPFETMVKNVRENPFRPIKWLKEHKGMQGFDYYEPHTKESIACQDAWNSARESAILEAMSLSSLGISKQFCNRLLEPFMWHTVVATGTEWENFFALRAHPMAEIHIQDLAFKMLEEYNKSEPMLLKAGQWHIPFRDNINQIELSNYAARVTNGLVTDILLDQLEAKISAAICAGVSYGRIKNVIDIADMIDLHDSLVIRPYSGKRGERTLEDPIHASPVEHQAKSMSREEYESWGKFEGWDSKYYENHSLGWCHNFRGFIQYRAMLDNENSKDKRVIL